MTLDDFYEFLLILSFVKIYLAEINDISFSGKSNLTSSPFEQFEMFFLYLYFFISLAV